MSRTSVMKPVTQDDFNKVCVWIKNNYSSVRAGIRSPRPVENVLDFLDKISAQSWADQGNGAPGFEVVIAGLNDGTTESLASQVRTYLEAASLALGFKSMLNVRHEGGRRFRPYWKEWPRAAAALRSATHGREFTTIALFGELIPVEFSAEFVRGVYSMARELGVRVLDRRTPKLLCEMGDDYLIRAAGELDRTTTSILIAFDNSDQTAEQSDHLKNQGYHVVGIGHLQRAIALDNAALASQLAGQCNADHMPVKTKAKKSVYILNMAIRVKSRDFVIRTAGLQRELQNSGLYDVKEITVAQTHIPPHDSSPTVIASVEDALRQIDPKQAVALFPRVDPFTKIAIRWVADNEPYRHIKVYGEKFLSRDLAMLSDPESPLAAICGVDPYYYGRYAVRAASVRLGDRKLPVLPPVLISKQEAVEGHFCMADRIPANFKGCDVKLHGPAFAWFDWMRDCCPGSYGPDLLGHD